MQDDTQFLKSSYDYTLPNAHIAIHPIHPKEDAKLLVYERHSDTITHTTFHHFLDLIPKECALIYNDTKVIKARIFGNKQSGGACELLLNSPYKDNTFLCYIKGKVKGGTQILFEVNLKAQVEQLLTDGMRSVRFFEADNEIDFERLQEILEQIGHVPLPPYIKREDAKEDEVEYQSIFAQNAGAVAAPTASLHFSETMFEKIQRDFTTANITLHVGAGTFKPVESEDIRHHVMHAEEYSISKKAKKIIQSDQKILAIGTTVTRCVEYFVRTKKPQGLSNLFLHPYNKPQRVDYLLTNFHLPQSTLLMLVASFIGREKTLQLYQNAIDNKYRFYSYGDAMLIV